MISWLKPAAAAAPLPLVQVAPTYRRLRRRVFLGIFAGYAAYYLVRNNLALAIPDILHLAGADRGRAGDEWLGTGHGLAAVR